MSTKAPDDNDLKKAGRLPRDPFEDLAPVAVPNPSLPDPTDEDAPAEKTPRPEAGASSVVSVTNIAVSRTDSWPEPRALSDGLPAVPQFDGRLLPEALRPWLTDVAERAQCPLEFAAVGAIVGAGSVIGRGCGIHPKRHDDWLVIPNLWGGAVGPPSSMKSPALGEALRPLRRLAAEAVDAHARQMETHGGALAEADVRRTAAKEAMKRAVKAGQDTATLRAEFVAAADPPKPTERRYIVNDATVEKLGELLNENPRGLLHYRDELGGWLAVLDRDGHQNDRSFFLEAWEGSGRYTYDRIGRGTLHIEAACVSMLGGIQPAVLAQYMRQAVRGGAGDDGLMQRFQVMVYPDAAGTWKNVDRWPDSDARNRALQVFRRLDELTPAGLGSDADPSGGVPALRFDAAAQELFDSWRGDLMGRLRTGEEHPAIESHLAKYPSLFPSLALISHLADATSMPPGRVGLASAQRAAAWCDLLEAHARRVYYAITAANIGAARTVLARLKAGALKTGAEPFTARDIGRRQWAGVTTSAEAEAALDVLEDHGWVRSIEIPADPAGGYPKPRVVYTLHPLLAAAGRAAA